MLVALRASPGHRVELAEAVFFVDLVGAGDPGKIEQAIPTTAGALYTMTFHYTTHAAGFCTFGGAASATATAGTSFVRTIAPRPVAYHGAHAAA